MTKKLKIIISAIVVISVSVISILMIFNNKSKEAIKEITTTGNTTEVKTNIEDIITTTSKPKTEKTTVETTKDITTTEEQKTTLKTNNSSGGNSNSSSNKTQNTVSTNKETTKVQTTKPVTTTEKTTVYDDYYDKGKFSFGYTVYSNPHHTDLDGAYWTYCSRKFIWCEDSQGSCDDCYIQKEVYGFEGNGMWHPIDFTISGYPATNEQFLKIFRSQEPSTKGKYEGQTFELKFWVWTTDK